MKLEKLHQSGSITYYQFVDDVGDPLGLVRFDLYSTSPGSRVVSVELCNATTLFRWREIARLKASKDLEGLVEKLLRGLGL